MQVYFLLVFSSFFFSCLELFTQQLKKKYFKIIQKIYIFIIFLLFIFNRENSDYGGYLGIFNGEIPVAEKGYLYLVEVLKIVNGNHNTILLILGTLLILVLFNIYRIRYQICFIFLYSILAFIYDINQIRNLLCILFILIGIKCLQKKMNIFYIIFNIFGILFHRLGYIYIIFFVLSKFKLRYYVRMIILLFLSGFILIPIIKQVILFLFTDKAIIYFKHDSPIGMLAYCVLITIDIFLLKISYDKELTNNNEIFIKLILFQIIFLPYSSLLIEMMGRVYRNTLYIKWFYFLERLNIREENKLLIFFLLTFQQIILLGALLFKNFDGMVFLLSQISNIKFYI